MSGNIDDSTVVGIDLGTTYSVIAYIDAERRPVTITNRAGELLTASALIFDDDRVIVGREASKLSTLSPEVFADCFKRDKGCRHFRKEIRHAEVPPQVLSAFVLRQLKQDAESRIGPVRKAVITVPAFFDESRRKATYDAGRLAGFEVLDIINEPTAAAVAYGYQLGLLAAEDGSPPSPCKRILVYDLGGGTFDVTVLEIDGSQFRAVATDGDVCLGGRDFDQRIVDYIAQQFSERHGVDPRADAHDAAQLWLDAQEAKHALSERTKTDVVCFHAGLRERITITRGIFDTLTQDLLERTRLTTKLVVKQAKLDQAQIDHVILVGGSTRMPAVAEMLREVTGKEPDRSISPDEAVAHGAALYANQLATQGGETNQQDFELININSHSLGIVAIDSKTRRQTNVILIPKNTPLPIQASRTFHTAEAGQRTVQVTVVEGESRAPNHCITLGQCIVRDLPEGLPQGTEIAIDYGYASDGCIWVSARVASTRQSAHVEIRRDEAHDLKDLDTWRRHLVPLGYTDTAVTNVEGEDEAAQRKHLDTLFRKLGSCAINMEVPEALLNSRDAVRSSQKELAVRNQIADVFLTHSDNRVYDETLDVILEALQSRFGYFGYIDHTGELVVPSFTGEIWDMCETTDKRIVFPRDSWDGLMTLDGAI